MGKEVIWDETRELSNGPRAERKATYISTTQRLNYAANHRNCNFKHISQQFLSEVKADPDSPSSSISCTCGHKSVW